MLPTNDEVKRMIDMWSMGAIWSGTKAERRSRMNIAIRAEATPLLTVMKSDPVSEATRASSSKVTVSSTKRATRYSVSSLMSSNDNFGRKFVSLIVALRMSPAFIHVIISTKMSDRIAMQRVSKGKLCMSSV